MYRTPLLFTFHISGGSVVKDQECQIPYTLPHVFQRLNKIEGAILSNLLLTTCKNCKGSSLLSSQYIASYAYMAIMHRHKKPDNVLIKHENRKIRIAD